VVLGNVKSNHVIANDELRSRGMGGSSCGIF
jgi:hypothetical protein